MAVSEWTMPKDKQKTETVEQLLDVTSPESVYLMATTTAEMSNNRTNFDSEVYHIFP